MFAGILGLTILGDCVSAVFMKMEQLTRSWSCVAQTPLPAHSLVTTDSQLLNPITVVFSTGFLVSTPTPGRFGL